MVGTATMGLWVEARSGSQVEALFMDGGWLWKGMVRKGNCPRLK